MLHHLPELLRLHQSRRSHRNERPRMTTLGGGGGPLQFAISWFLGLSGDDAVWAGIILGGIEGIGVRIEGRWRRPKRGGFLRGEREVVVVVVVEILRWWSGFLGERKGVIERVVRNDVVYGIGVGPRHTSVSATVGSNDHVWFFFWLYLEEEDRE